MYRYCYSNLGTISAKGLCGRVQFLCHSWIEFVVGFRPALEVLMRVLRFSSLSKSNSTQIEEWMGQNIHNLLFCLIF